MELPTSMHDLFTVRPKLSLVDVQANGNALPTPPPEADDFNAGADARFPHVPAAYSRFERRMGDSELSYYLPSRADGVNDMYLHLGMRSASKLLTPARVEAVWALLRLRHPLLASTVEMEPGQYASARFVYTPPSNVECALREGRATVSWKQGAKDEMISEYLNGERTLSDQRLSYLIVSTPATATQPLRAPLTPPATPSMSRPSSPSSESDAEPATAEDELDVLIAAAHFIGDGMALHMFANDFLQLLTGGDSFRTDGELLQLLGWEWEKRWGNASPSAPTFSLPCALEDGLTVPPTRMTRAIARVDFLRHQQKFIGGHSFPKAAVKVPRRTVVSTVSFDPDTTKRMLKNCKSHGVSISSALFAVCNVAAARTQADRLDPKLPLLAYSAMNLRPQLHSHSNSYWFLAVGYFNVVLPSFVPRALPLERVFWHRALSAKQQSARAAGPFVRSRAQQMAEERGRRARRWAREDDGVPADPADVEVALATGAETAAPSRAFVGLSLLGNLDGIYKHANYAPLTLHTLTTGSRQRSGGMLIFGYTFANRLWLSLGWDVHGFDQAAVESFWNEYLTCTKEFLDPC